LANWRLADRALTGDVAAAFADGHGTPTDQAADAGGARSMVDLAMLEPTGERRTALLERAAVQGSIEGMLGLAADLVADPEASDEALSWFRRAKVLASLDVDHAVTIGRLYRDGRLIPKDPMIARSWFERAAVAGDPVAMRETGLEALADTRDRRLDEGRTWLAAATTLGDVVAIEALAGLYRSERLGEAEPDRAFRLTHLAAYHGSTRAMIEVAAALEHGIGVDPGTETAEAWRSRAAAAGDVDAMVLHGRALIEAEGGERGQEGVSLLSRAAERGHHGSLLTLGRLHLEGRHVDRDEKRARNLLEAAADGGNLEARLARLQSADTDANRDD
jgi:TPR repeat protein